MRDNFLRDESSKWLIIILENKLVFNPDSIGLSFAYRGHSFNTMAFNLIYDLGAMFNCSCKFFNHFSFHDNCAIGIGNNVTVMNERLL